MMNPSIGSGAGGPGFGCSRYPRFGASKFSNVSPPYYFHFTTPEEKAKTLAHPAKAGLPFDKDDMLGMVGRAVAKTGGQAMISVSQQVGSFIVTANGQGGYRVMGQGLRPPGNGYLANIVTYGHGATVNRETYRELERQDKAMNVGRPLARFDSTV